MSRRIWALPIRALPIRALPDITVRQPQWVCQRCLATQGRTSPASEPITPLIPAASISEDSALLAEASRAKRQQTWQKLQHLRESLPHPIPSQYLQHCDESALIPDELAQREHILPHQKIRGVVVSAGKMHKTVTVRVPGRTWNKRIGKYYSSHTSHLVHDPNSSLSAGDVVELHRLRVSSAVQHVVASIVAPFGKPIEQRPPIPTPEERLDAYKGRRIAKLHRRDLRVRAAQGDVDAINQLRAEGLDPGDGIEEGRGGARKSRNVQRRSISGNKGQKLPTGILPGGKHEVGKIDDRAKHNKEKAMKLDEKTEANLLQAKGKQEELEAQGLASDTVIPNKK